MWCEERDSEPVFARAYQNFSKPKIRQTTQECYENRIYNHIIPEIGKIPMNMKEKILDERRKQLEKLNVVSVDENAYWLIDYWCGKEVKGLIQMPFSRHWIMHIEACLKIRDKQLSIK